MKLTSQPKSTTSGKVFHTFTTRSLKTQIELACLSVFFVLMPAFFTGCVFRVVQFHRHQWPFSQSVTFYSGLNNGDREIAGLTLTRCTAEYWPSRCRTKCPFKKQCNLALVEGRWCFEARKVTVSWRRVALRHRLWLIYGLKAYE